MDHYSPTQEALIDPGELLPLPPQQHRHMPSAPDDLDLDLLRPHPHEIPPHPLVRLEPLTLTTRQARTPT